MLSKQQTTTVIFFYPESTLQATNEDS